MSSRRVSLCLFGCRITHAFTNANQGLRLEVIERAHIEVGEYAQLRLSEAVGVPKQGSGNRTFADLSFRRCQRAAFGATDDDPVPSAARLWRAKSSSGVPCSSVTISRTICAFVPRSQHDNCTEHWQ